MKKVLKYLFLLLTLIFIFGSLFFLLKNLKVQNINCISQFGNCSPDLQAEILKAKDKNIFESFSLLKNSLKKENKVLGYSINLTLPFNLEINCIERTPIIAFNLKNGNFALVDKDGVIADVAKNTTLPKILSSTPVSNEQLIFISGLMHSLNTFYNINEGKITENGLEISNLNKKRVIFPLSGDKDILLGSLNLILSRLPSVQEASTISTIDLRFKNPILK